MKKPADCDILHQGSPRPQVQTLLHDRGRPDIITFIILHYLKLSYIIFHYLILSLSLSYIIFHYLQVGWGIRSHGAYNHLWEMDVKTFPSLITAWWWIAWTVVRILLPVWHDGDHDGDDDADHDHDGMMVMITTIIILSLFTQVIIIVDHCYHFLHISIIYII